MSNVSIVSNLNIIDFKRQTFFFFWLAEKKFHFSFFRLKDAIKKRQQQHNYNHCMFDRIESNKIIKCFQ